MLLKLWVVKSCSSFCGVCNLLINYSLKSIQVRNNGHGSGGAEERHHHAASCECSDTDVRAVNEKFHWRNPLLGPFSCWKLLLTLSLIRIYTNWVFKHMYAVSKKGVGTLVYNDHNWWENSEISRSSVDSSNRHVHNIFTCEFWSVLSSLVRNISSEHQHLVLNVYIMF